MIEINYKIILIGDAFVGKTSLLLYLLQHKIDSDIKPTIGVSFIQHTITLEDGTTKKLDIWDTTGDERYRSVLPSYFRKTSVAIICFDVTNRESFNSLDFWIEMSKTHCGENTKIILVGTKSELQNVVSLKEAKGFADASNFELFYCSSLTGENVVEVFQRAAQIATPPELCDQQQTNFIEMKKDQIDDSGCC